MSTPLTPEQYSELVVALEMLRSEYADGNDYCVERTLRAHWIAKHLSPFAFIYLIQWFGKLPSGIENDSQATVRAIDRMVAELCEERCDVPEYQTDVQAAFGGIVQTPQG